MSSKQSNQTHPVPSPGTESGSPVRVQGAFKDIFLAFAIIFLPLTILSGVLLGLIFYYRVVPNNSLSSTKLQLPQGSDASNDSFYLVDFSATKLTTVASWTSSVAPLLPGFVMTLLSYPASSRILKASKDESAASLMTPFQLCLFVSLLKGGIGSLWYRLKYSRWQKEKSVGTMKIVIAIFLLSTTLGYLILAADTWLHVTTSTIIYTQASPNAGTTLSYGRGIYADWCKNDTFQADVWAPCSVFLGADVNALVGSSEAYRTLNNLSATNSVLTFDQDGHTYAFLTDAQLSDNIDFQASTYAITTQCEPISKACHLEAVSGVSTPYNCTPAFSGDLDSSSVTSAPILGCKDNSIGWTYFTSNNLTSNITSNDNIQNPSYFGTWATAQTGYGTLDVNGSFTGTGSPLSNDPQIVEQVHGGLSWVLNCTQAIYDITYTYINGSVVTYTQTLSNASIASLFDGPYNFELACPTFSNLATIASSSNTSIELANTWAKLYSQSKLALSAGVMSPRANIVQQVREQRLVALVPKAPLFALVGLNLLYALVGVVLALLAMCASPSETRDVQARLSVEGLAAGLLEGERSEKPVKSVEELFAEWEEQNVRKVRIKRTQMGGWKYSLSE